jgi:SHS2 domain-containing protein
MKQKPFYQLEHMADVKYKITGNNPNEIFQNSAKAFSSYISSDSKISSKLNKKVSLSADNIEMLLYKFIDELIYLLDAENFAVSKAKIKLSKDNKSLTGELYGDNSKNYRLNHVKAATYAEMYIKIVTKKWEAQFVLDV